MNDYFDFSDNDCLHSTIPQDGDLNHGNNQEHSDLDYNPNIDSVFQQDAPDGVSIEDSPFDSPVETLDSNIWEQEEIFHTEGGNHNGTEDSSSEIIDITQITDGIAFKATQSEINNHISKAEHDIADAKSDIRHHTYMANSKARMGEPHSSEDYQIRMAEIRLEKATNDLHKWQQTKPEPSK